ncbi:MAG: lysylphosphatidylglycerol synthase transmembrane domain-containing protein [Bacteroidota bacterium]
MDRSEKALKTLNPNKAIIPVVIGLAIVLYIFFTDPNLTLDNLKLIFKASFPVLILSLIVLLCRDMGYIYRIRTLTSQDLSWKSSVYVILLWEFASAVTPSVVGGTAVAIFILMKENIKLGRAIAYVILTAILDNMYFIIGAPIVLLFTDGEVFPGYYGQWSTFFYISYSLILTYTLVMCFAVFFKPRLFKWLLIRLTGLKYLRKWRAEAVSQGDELILASKELRGKQFSYWVKIIAATAFIWTARYLLLNTIISAFTAPTFDEHISLFSRQIIMWVVMLISPTPGAAGVAEVSFGGFFKDYLGELILIINIVWRLLTFYFYLFVGIFVLRKWIGKVFKGTSANAG